MLVEAVRSGTLIHPQARKSVFWEINTTVSDPAFEKEAWLSSTLLRFGDCGFTISDKATIFFCAPVYAQGHAKLPTSPVSEDAAIITSLFSTPAVDLILDEPGLDAVLLDAAIMNLTARDFSAVEAFGYRDAAETTHLLGSKPASIGLLPVEILEAAGFEVIHDHPATPRLRMELPPTFDLLTAMEALPMELSSLSAQ